jgi:phosphotransferase system HPr-like phosphotransfer protein
MYCTYISRDDVPRDTFTKKLYSELIATSQVLEDFLDFHGAKNNNNWYFYRELAAAVRHLSLSGYCQKHISNRLPFYNLSDKEAFEKEGKVTTEFLTTSLMRIAPVVIEEAKRLRISVPDGSFYPADFPPIVTCGMLDYDIDDAARSEQRKHIVKIASEFLSIAEQFDLLGFYEPYTYEEILEIVPAKVNEVEIRRFEMLVHNLQSSFDTYVIQGGLRFGNRKFKKLRGFFSVVFHLLQMMGRLLHFYERHLHEAGYKNIYKKVQDRLSALVDPEVLLDRTINYGLYYACHFLSTGRELAREILNENIDRSAVKVPIPKDRGFHCRPSLLVAKIVQHYGGQVELCVSNDRFDASSVLDMQWAGGKIQQEEIRSVVFEGDTRALKDIDLLASLNYCEDTFGKETISFPKELQYLR